MRILVACILAALSLAPARAGERLYLEYHADAWGFVPLGQASMDVSVRPDGYRVGATLASGGFAKLFDNTVISANADGAVTPTGPAWSNYALDHTYAKKHRTTAMRVDPAGVMTDVNPKWLKLGEPPATDAQKRAARDPLSSIVAMAVSVARTHECSGTYPTFDGRFLYELRFKGEVKTGHYKTDGYDGPVLKCELNYVPIAGYDAKDYAVNLKRTPRAEMWFALTDNPDFAPPVRLVLPLGLGSAVLTLTEWRKATVSVDDSAAPTSLPMSAPPAIGPSPTAHR